MLQLSLGVGVILVFGVMALWSRHPALFIVTGVVTVFVGFFWFDTIGGWYGLGIGLILLIAGFTFFEMAYRAIFGKDKE